MPTLKDRRNTDVLLDILPSFQKEKGSSRRVNLKNRINIDVLLDVLRFFHKEERLFKKTSH